MSKVLLVGSFGGRWNLGDMVQLAGTIEWHARLRDPGSILNLVSLYNIRNRTDLERIMRAYGTSVVVFGRGPAPADLGLVEVPDIPNLDLLHFYGGGVMNSFFADARLPVLEFLLQRHRPERYVISGQQVQPSFAPVFGRHIRQYSPVFIGCRDEPSVAALHNTGVRAVLSGDDTWETFGAVRAAVDSARLQPTTRRRTFSLQLGIPRHVYHVGKGQPAALARQGVIEALNAALVSLKSCYGNDIQPILINAFMDPAENLDTASSLQQTVFPEQFPHSVILDLPGLMLNRQLKTSLQAVFSEYNIERHCGTYYHPTLLFKILGVPAFLFAFNDYYRQKASGLGQEVDSFEAFMRHDSARHLELQEAFIKKMSAVRKEWLDRLAALDKV